MTTKEIRDAKYRELAGQLTGLRAQVHTQLTIWGPCTTRKLAECSGIDILTVRPRVTELVEAGLAELTGREDGEGIYAAVRITSAIDRHVREQVNAARPKQLALLSFLVVFMGTLSASAIDVTLAWDPPTNCVDGTPVTRLDGYTLYRGLTSRVYTCAVELPNVTTAMVSGLGAMTTHYFAVTARADGQESAYSDELAWYALPTNAITQMGYSLATRKLSVTWNAPIGVTGVTAYVLGIGSAPGVYSKTNSYGAGSRSSTITWTNGWPLWAAIGYTQGTNRSPWSAAVSVGPGQIPTGRLR